MPWAHTPNRLGTQSKTWRLVNWQRWSPHLQPSGAVGVVHAGERYRPLGPPPSLQSATAVLTAARGKSVDQMPPQVADYPRNALQNEGRGVRRLPEDRQPRMCRVANWAPQTARLPAGNVIPTATATQARPGRWSLGGLVSCAIAFSLNHDRLAVMHQPIESGGGLWMSQQGTGGPHRGCRWADSPVPDRGDKPWKRQAKYDTGNYHPGKGDGASRQGRKRT